MNRELMRLQAKKKLEVKTAQMGTIKKAKKPKKKKKAKKSGGSCH